MPDDLKSLQCLVISAPFGNYFGPRGYTRTLGTFTWQHRAGFLRRWWRVLRTVRPWPRAGAWVNRLGLPNPGLRSLTGRDLSACLLSVHGFTPAEWHLLGRFAVGLNPLALEANLSCPNVTSFAVGTLMAGCLALLNSGLPVIAKLPPLRWMSFARPLYAGGVRAFHLCNTLPTPGGGLSGKPLMPLSLWAVEEVRQAFGASVRIVGGGGVTCPADADAYLDAGADHVAVGSMLLNPLRWRQLAVIRDHLARRGKGAACPTT